MNSICENQEIVFSSSRLLKIISLVCESRLSRSGGEDMNRLQLPEGKEAGVGAGAGAGPLGTSMSDARLISSSLTDHLNELPTIIKPIK